MIIIGHRGVKSLAFENTIESFQKAIELDVDIIELDVFLTKDNQIVVSHDNYLERLLKKPLFIHNLTLHELQKYNLPNGESIKTLEEVIYFIDKKISINIEIKPQPIKICEILVTLLLNLFKKKWNKYDFLISSYDFTILERIYQLNSSIFTGLIQSNNFTNQNIYLDFATKINAATIHIDIELLNSNSMIQQIKKYKKNNINVYIFTVNHPNIIYQIKNYNDLIDGIITDNPSNFINF
jgi:glycerophosphoryl diester phosphodiesterase